MENAIVEYLDYQIPVTQLNGDKQQSGYSRVPRLSDTRYSAIWRYASSKARLKCATYRRYTDLSVIGVIPVTQLYGDMQAAKRD